MSTPSRSSVASVWDIVGYVALVLIAVVAAGLYFQDTTPPKPAEPAPVAPRVVVPPESLLDRLTRQARAGDVVSQRHLGEVYANGMGVREDDVEAAKWFKMAAEKGDVIAARILGYFYARGDGVPKSDSEAVSWWRFAAGRGDADAAYSLGVAYLKGEGVQASEAEGLSYCRLAADRGNTWAQYYLGTWHYDGVLVTKSHKEAFYWFRKAALRGHPDAQNYLGVMYRDGESVSPSDVEAVRWFRFAASHHSGEGCHNLGQLLSAGRGADKDEALASAQFLKGAMLEHIPAQVELARRYLTGVGLTVDPVEAFAWYDMAASKGHAPAATTRDGMVRQLTAAQVAAGKERSAALLREIASRKASRLRP